MFQYLTDKNILIQSDRLFAKSYLNPATPLFQDDVVELLDRLFPCEQIISSEEISVDGVIDLYDNWNNCKIDSERLNKYSRVEVKIALIEQMLKTAISNSTDYEGKEIVERLKYIKSGQFVPREWGWITLTGDPYFGSINFD